MESHIMYHKAINDSTRLSKLELLLFKSISAVPLFIFLWPTGPTILGPSQAKLSSAILPARGKLEVAIICRGWLEDIWHHYIQIHNYKIWRESILMQFWVHSIQIATANTEKSIYASMASNQGGPSEDTSQRSTIEPQCRKWCGILPQG